MREKLIFIIITIFCTGAVSLVGCGAADLSDETAYFDGNEHYHPSRNYMTSEGYYFMDENGMLHFFDFASQETVYVCDKPECPHVLSHEGGDGTCNAEIDAISGITVYGGFVYYIAEGDGYNEADLRKRDTDGNNDEKVATLEGEAGSSAAAWFYRDIALVRVSTATSKSFDAETKESENQETRLYRVDLKTGDTSLLDTSSLGDIWADVFVVHKMEDGKFYYYSQETDSYSVYDTESGDVSKRDVACTADFTQVIYGNNGDYCYIAFAGGFCYGFRINGENTELIRMDIETGEEEIYFSGVDSYPEFSCFETYQAIYDYADGTYYVYNMETGELSEVGGAYVSQAGVGAVPMEISEYGVIYSVAVHQTDMYEAYDGDFEYQYVSLQSYLSGGNDYVPVYYLDQESGQ
ncbi:MAG: hypothetical protein LUE90_01805 [Clostridiales bacterium]|nr:hypothetical protein [Clostridiales bacterium]